MKEYKSGRFTFIPSDLELLKSELESNQSLSSRLRAFVFESWPPGEYDRNAIEYFIEKLRLKGPAAEGWLGWYVLAETDSGKRDLIAAAGFFGPPDEEGSVEIGYSIVEEWRGKGAATEIVEFLVKTAFGYEYVNLIKARTSKDNAASIKVLQKNGFFLSGSGEEPDSLIFHLKK